MPRAWATSTGHTPAGARAAMTAGESPDGTTSPDGSPQPATDRAAQAFGRLVGIMARLRGPDGCPWDREQTLHTLAPFVLEEAAEVVDAIERGDVSNLQEEVGDLLFEAVFLAQVSHDDGGFAVEQALDAINTKLVRRHPHVFERDTALSPEQVKAQWDVIKRAEKAQRGETRMGVLDGVPVSLPALMRASALCRKAATVGFDWPTPDAVLEKVDEELAEVRSAVAAGDRAGAAEELGDLLFVIANLARRLEVDPEAALRSANRKFERRFVAMHAHVDASGGTLEAASLADLEASWQAVKQAERNSSRDE
jgi:ATP diphosphatase